MRDRRLIAFGVVPNAFKAATSSSHPQLQRVARSFDVTVSRVPMRCVVSTRLVCYSAYRERGLSRRERSCGLQRCLCCSRTRNGALVVPFSPQISFQTRPRDRKFVGVAAAGPRDALPLPRPLGAQPGAALGAVSILEPYRAAPQRSLLRPPTLRMRMRDTEGKEICHCLSFGLMHGPLAGWIMLPFLRAHAEAQCILA